MKTSSVAACAALLLILSLPLAAPDQAAATGLTASLQQARNADEKADKKGKETRRRKGKKGDEGDEDEEKSLLSSATLSGLKLRPLGPAIASGRVVDFAVDPANPKHYYVATASGGVWETKNSGTTYEPIFDREASYSIGCITLDPNDAKTVWVGTGENNSQRSVSYGDGVYKSIDGGKNWSNVGLESSEHIGMITIDPRDSNVVYVAAQGPLWSAGGDRGLYKTIDGGATWSKVLEIDEHTGVSEVHLDPRNPDVLYAVAYQRARRVWTLIDGGPGSAIYKSTDAGKSWSKLKRGLPSGDLGRIGLAISPVDPDVLYAIIEKEGDGEGVYRSQDAGENWSKRSSYVSGSPQYYQELVADPVDVDRLYSMDTLLQVSDDGGATWRPAGEDEKHVDNHALWIDPDDPDHLLVGCDGGIYESFDRAQTWEFKPNLPITQFYKIAISNEEPFYFVYGGTQDNNTLGGPTRTKNRHGIENSDWFVTVGGDGFQPAVDPTNPDIVYSEWQYGNLVRYDRKSGETVDIKPRSEPGEEPLRWNWDSPLIISPHDPARLYYASQAIFRSDDRGDSWERISDDMSRGLDRNALEIMGKVWSIDAVAKNASTSVYGNVVALSESPLTRDLLYASTDDGLVWVMDPETGEWRKIEELPGVERLAYIADVVASRHDADTAYVVANNHKAGDFRPYLLKTTDRGQSWTHIEGDLPARGSTWVVVEDPVDPRLLFVGTEFGLFTSLDGGESWVQLKSGLPTIAVRDLKIQEREGDLVVGTFGRGFYVLDDYTALRGLSEQRLEGEPAILFPARRAYQYVPASPSTGSLGHSFYTAENPPYGATFTYYLKEPPKTLEKLRKEREKEAEDVGETPPYPTFDELREEEREEAPKIVLEIADENGEMVRRVEAKAGKGLQRVTWDLTYPPTTPVQLGSDGRRRGGFRFRPRGLMVAPGRYTATLTQLHSGERTQLAAPVSFTVEALNQYALPPQDRRESLRFYQQAAELQRAVMGAARALAETQTRVDHLQKAAFDTPPAGTDVLGRLLELETRLDDLRIELQGDTLVRRYNEAAPPSIQQRLQTVLRGAYSTTYGPTGTHRHAFELASEAFAPWLDAFRELVETDLAAIERQLDELGAPWTPGRIPTWKRGG